MTLAQLTEKRNKVMADASALLAGTDVTAEQRTQFDAHMVEARSLEGDIARVKAIEDHKAEQRNAPTPARPNPGESNDPEERAEVRNARVKASFRTYLSTGVRETRDLSLAGNGVVVPTLFQPQVIEAQRSYGDILTLVTPMTTDHGNPIKMVLDNDTGNGLQAVTVGTNVTEEDPSLAGETLNVDNYSTGVIKVDNGLLSDAGFDLEAFIRDKFGKRYFRGGSNLIVNGGSAVQSLLTAYSGNGITTASVGIIKYADFTAAMAALDPAYQANSVWVMNNATLGAVLSIVDGNGRPLFLAGFGDGTQGFVGTILGRPVRLVTQLPALATGNVPILFGDFKEAYTFRQQAPGIGILRLNEMFALGFQTGFVGFARVGGIATDAGTHPIIGITIK